jgi:hypothetical protein
MPKNAMESADQIMIHVNAEITPKAFMSDLSIILGICGVPHLWRFTSRPAPFGSCLSGTAIT